MTAPLSADTPQFNRRGILTEAPTLGFVDLVGVGAATVAADATQTPVAAMHREITRVQELLNQPDRGLTDVEADAACDHMIELANEIAYLPSEGPMDILIKIAGHTVNGDHELRGMGPGDQIWTEMMGMVAPTA